MQVWAQAASNTLAAYYISLAFNTSQLAFSSVTHPLYSNVLYSTAVPNALTVTGSGGSPSTAITGWFLASTIVFTVTDAAAGETVLMSMPANLNNAMTNLGATTYLNNFVGLFGI